MKKGTKIKQHDITDCGAACLASVCAHYELRFPVSRIRQYAFTDQKGTNVLGLIEAANKLGLSAKGVRAQFDALYTIPKPTIAHVLVNHKQLQHFVVIYKVTKTHITYPRAPHAPSCATAPSVKWPPSVPATTSRSSV